ncbi:beta-ketoacyl synthase N-terminal-like domain-containing protein [Stenotrophomonas rhizophila]
MSSADKDRIVVTGMGVVSPLGCGVETVWSRLLAGRSGIGSLGAELAAGTGCEVGGRVPDRIQDPEAGFDSTGIIAPKDLKKMDRFVEFALVAAHEALEQAGWQDANARGLLRTATVIATGIGGFGSIVNAVHTTDSRGHWPAVAVHCADLPGQHGGGAGVDPLRVQGPAGRARHGLRGGRPGHW